MTDQTPPQQPSERPPVLVSDETGLDPKGLAEMRKEIWAKAVDTQMHFNEMCVKSRQLGLSFVVAALGVAAVLLSRPESFQVRIPLGQTLYGVHTSSLLILVAALGLIAVSWLDLGVYHQMLRGAVEFGECLERERLGKIMGTPNGMTELISIYSRFKTIERPTASGAKYQGKEEFTAERKIKRFYWGSIVVLLALSFLLGFATYRSEARASVGSEVSGIRPDGGAAREHADAF
jgi:hypothetical protein